MSFEHMEPYTWLSPAEQAVLEDRALVFYAEAEEADARADARRDRRDDHAEAVCPASRARWRACADERRAASELYPRGDVAATPRTNRGEAA